MSLRKDLMIILFASVVFSVIILLNVLSGRLPLLYSQYSSPLTPQLKSNQELSLPGTCHVSNIAPWRQGVVTQLQPAIEHNCDLLVSRSEWHIEKVQAALKHWKNNDTEEQLMERISRNSCEYVRSEFSNNFYVSQEELDFPIAYELVVYSRAIQVIRFLKVIYRPHNLYCIHVDAKSDEKFITLFRELSNCLDNVFVASKLSEVYYRHYTILEAQLNCLEDLVLFEKTRWKYVINVVGTELPLKTNREIVRSLKKLHGVSLVDSHPIEKKFYHGRFTRKCVIDNRRIHITSKKLDPIPHNISIYKGSTHFAATREFVEYTLFDQVAVDFRNYLKDVCNAEESFYASLYRLPEATAHGGFMGKGMPMPRVVENLWKRSPQIDGCPARYGLSGHFFFNKYFLKEDTVVMDCAEERLVQLNIKEYVLDCNIGGL